MSNLHQRYPWLVTAVCAVLFLLVALVGTPIGDGIEKSASLPMNSGVLIQQVLLVLFSALVVTVFGGWRAAGFAQPFQWRAFLLTAPMLIGPLYLLFTGGIAPTTPLQLAMLVVFTAMIGFAEEALCRGMMVNAFLPRGVMKAAVFSSLVFGAMHLIHLFYGVDIVTALLYVFYTSLIGFGFAAPYIRTGGGMWPVVAVHALFDFFGKLGHGWGAQAQPTSSTEIVVRLILAILVGLYGYWLLRRRSAVSTALPSPAD